MAWAVRRRCDGGHDPVYAPVCPASQQRFRDSVSRPHPSRNRAGVMAPVRQVLAAEGVYGPS
jgi:hypothetical protein